MSNKILIFGKGYIAARLQEELKCMVSTKKIFTFADAQNEIKRFRPKTIINCIGTIGRNVDDCELDIDKTLVSNTFVPLILAETALRNNLKFVHISSGCIYHYDYGRDKPIIEAKTPDFFGLFYSRSKIYSEQALVGLSTKYPILIIRIRVPLDDRPHPKNLLNKLISYGKVIDVPNSVTYIPDFLGAFKHLLKINAAGIYNVANEGGLRYPSLLDVYKKYAPDFSYKLVSFKSLNLVRTNLILSTAKLSKTGFKVRRIDDVLDECVSNYTRQV